LAGLRVIDFCWMIAGPLTTRLLADLGAEVIKVESLARVDRIREVGVQPPTPNAETNGVFNDCNVNKKSITLNLGTAKGIEIAKALIARADIVTSNFTPDRMDRWGLGYDVLRALNPGIIVASLPVMGSVGPRAGWRAVGNGVIALAGLNGLTGFPEREPVGLGTLHSDFTTPYVGALAILADPEHHEMAALAADMQCEQPLCNIVAGSCANNRRAAGQRLNRGRQGFSINTCLRISELFCRPADDVAKICLGCFGKQDRPCARSGWVDRRHRTAFAERLPVMASSATPDRWRETCEGDSKVRNRPASTSAMPTRAASRKALRRALASASSFSTRRKPARSTSLAF
jgi:crotonobetainyl-CoA:carnitine CoA-transferase CaiB-like acyl-CoA transferase